MHAKDIRIRNTWLAMVVVSALVSITELVYGAEIGAELQAKAPWIRYLNALFSVLIIVGLRYLIYHCAYKKMGTGLLEFILILNGGRFFFIVTSWMIGETVLPHHFFAQVRLALSYLFLLFSSYLHWKMRAINQKFQERLASKLI